VRGRKFWWVLACIGMTFFSNAVLAQYSSRGATFYSRIKLKKIPVNVGLPFKVQQYCTTEIDTVIHADRFFWENASIGKIKSCKLDFAMQNDTVQFITIYLTGHKYFEKAKKQAVKEFGPAVIVLDTFDDIYTWTTTNGQNKVLITLVRKNQEWGSEMTINLFEQ
jgi:hypothetical protein